MDTTDLHSEASRLSLNMHRLKRTNRANTAAIVWAPRRGRWPARFAVLGVYELERVKYMENDPWRLVGVYRIDVPFDHLAEDLAAWSAEYAAAIA